MGSLEHVLHVLGVDEGVVDGHNVHHRVLQRRAQHQAPDASETVDANRHRSHRLFNVVMIAAQSSNAKHVKRRKEEEGRHIVDVERQGQDAGGAKKRQVKSVSVVSGEASGLRLSSIVLSPRIRKKIINSFITPQRI